MGLKKQIEKVIPEENHLFRQLFNFFYNKTVPSTAEIKEAVATFKKLNDIPFRNEGEQYE